MVWLHSIILAQASWATAGKVAEIRQNAGCSFHLTAGSNQLPVGQLSNGQCRGGTSMAMARFTWFGDSFLDQQSRGCWWTPPSTVLQCDSNQQPDHGFAIDCSGMVSYQNQSVFFQCHTGEDDQINLYLRTPGGNCSQTSIRADSCRPPSCSVLPATPSPTLVPSNSNSSGLSLPTASTLSSLSSNVPVIPGLPCTTNLTSSSAWEYPHLILPISRSNPDKAYGPTYFGQVTPNATSIFNFDIPATYAGMTCSLAFLFPPMSHLATYAHHLTGTGQLGFALLTGVAVINTTWNTAPAVANDLGTIEVAPGNSYVISTFICPGAKKLAFAIRGVVGDSTCFEYFQDWNPDPIGLYISIC